MVINESRLGTKENVEKMPSFFSFSRIQPIFLFFRSLVICVFDPFYLFFSYTLDIPFICLIHFCDLTGHVDEDKDIRTLIYFKS